jgi:hypothetical protein
MAMLLVPKRQGSGRPKQTQDDGCQTKRQTTAHGGANPTATIPTSKDAFLTFVNTKI